MPPRAQRCPLWPLRHACRASNSYALRRPRASHLPLTPAACAPKPAAYVAHQLWQIPATLGAQGFSTGLPERLQLALLRTLPGLEQVKILRAAYAVEYDFLPAHQCTASLMTKRIQGLFFRQAMHATTTCSTYPHLLRCVQLG